MTKHRLSSLPYDFIPTSFISKSVIINTVIEDLINNAVTGTIGSLDKGERFPKIITLNPIVQPFKVEESLKFIDKCCKRRSKITKNYVRDRFCIWKNLQVYADSKPTCFCVIGKPSPMQYRLAKYVSQKTGRYHIDVVRLVAREIIKNTPLGNWMWANLAWGKKIPIDICIRLLLDELGKSKYQIKGYVLSGMPIIPSCCLKEELLPFAIGKFPCVPPPYVSRVKRKKDMKTTQETVKNVTFEYDEVLSEASDVSVASSGNKKSDYVEAEITDNENEEAEQEFQSGELSEGEGSEEEFLTTSEESEDEDLEQNSRRLDFAKQGTYQLPQTEESVSYSIESQLTLLLDLNMRPDVIFYLAYDDEDIIAKKRNVRDEETIELYLQFVRYGNSVVCIQNFLLHYDSSSVIRMDGRLTKSELYKHTDNRLEYLCYKKLYKPERLFPDTIPDRFQQHDVKNDKNRCLQVLCETDTIQPNFNWLKSDCEAYCPVELFKGKRVSGNIDFAVRYLGYNFLMSSEGNVKEFLKNPNQYILSTPNCRVAIIGPRRVGKIIVAKILTSLLGAEIFSVKQKVCELYGDFCENKYAEAFRYAYDYAKKLTKTKFDYYTGLIKDKTEEWKENVLVNLKEALDPLDLNKSSFTVDDIASFLKDKDTLYELIPEEWQVETEYIEPSYTDPLVHFLLEEKLIELYCKSLSEQGLIAEHFIQFAAEKDEQIRRESNGEQEYGQWILLDPPLDLTFWKELERNHCLPDVVIFLSNCSEDKFAEILGHGLNAKFYKGRYITNQCLDLLCHCIRKNPLNIDEIVESLKQIRPMNESIAQYGRFLAVNMCKLMPDMFEKVEKLEEFLNSKSSILLTTNIAKYSWGKTIRNILLKYFYLFKTKPRLLDHIELRRLNELNRQIIDNDDTEEIEMEDEEEVEVESEEIEYEFKRKKDTVIHENDIFQNIRLGNTGKYCPVMYTDHDILLKGCPQYCVEYDNLIYPLSSQECYLQFIEHPEKYAHLHHKPLVPVPKIWVIGPNYSEKLSFSIALSDEFRIKLIIYNQLLKDFIQTTNVNEEISLYSLHDIDNVCLNDTMTGKLKKAFKDGAIMSGYPARKEQFQDLIDRNLYPEAIFVMDDRENLLQVLYNHQLQLWQRKQVTPREDEDINEEGYFHEFEKYESELDASAEFEIGEGEEECGFRKLTEADKREIYELCKNTLEMFLIDLEEMIILANNLNIPIIRVPKHFRLPNIIQRLRRKINNYSDRFSMFDQIFEISFDTAMKCINCGFCRWSRFKNSCPVDVHLLIDINHYMGSKILNKLQPCIFREYIYFINGKKNLCKFKLNPYKYVNTCNPYQYCSPLRIVVLGPHCSGTSTLCHRIAREFNMEVFKEEDFENVIKNKLYWTALYKKFINNGSELSENMLANCLLYHENITPNGIILDNFPFGPSYIVTAARFNVDFEIILLMKPTLESIWKNFKDLNPMQKIEPIKKLHQLYVEHMEFIDGINLINSTQELQLFNILTIDRVKSKWMVWNLAKNEIFKTVRSIASYESTIMRKRHSASLSHLNIFETEYKARLSSVGPMCPICCSIDKNLVKYRYDYLNVGKAFYDYKCQEEMMRPYGYNSKTLYQQFKFPHPWSTHSTVPPLLAPFSFKSNLVQYKNYFYWSCDNHLIELLLNSSSYLPVELSRLPAYVPFLVLNYMKIFVEHDGFCVVTYHKNLPERVFVKGDKNAIYYRGKVYLVASDNEALEFLRHPEKYYHVKVKLEDEEKLDLDVASMEIDFGYLTPSLITLALEELAKVRPKHFAMTTTESAATFIALYLKLYRNKKTPGMKEIYEQAFENFIFQCNILPNRLNKLMHNINPFIVRGSNEEELYYESDQISESSCRSLE